MSKSCYLCKKEATEEQVLCKECLEALTGIQDSLAITKLKAKAKKALVELVKIHCKVCKEINDVDSSTCTKCTLAEKEKLIRAFLE